MTYSIKKQNGNFHASAGGTYMVEIDGKFPVEPRARPKFDDSHILVTTPNFKKSWILPLRMSDKDLFGKNIK